VSHNLARQRRRRPRPTFASSHSLRVFALATITLRPHGCSSLNNTSDNTQPSVTIRQQLRAGLAPIRSVPPLARNLIATLEAFSHPRPSNTQKPGNRLYTTQKERTRKHLRVRATTGYVQTNARLQNARSGLATPTASASHVALPPYHAPFSDACSVTRQSPASERAQRTKGVKVSAVVAYEV